jgi:hypothetical protein
MGNLIFLRDDRLASMLPDVLECAGWLSEGAVRVGRGYKQTLQEREAVMRELERAADERLALIEELHEIAAERQRQLDAARSRPRA